MVKPWQWWQGSLLTLFHLFTVSIHNDPLHRTIKAHHSHWSAFPFQLGSFHHLIMALAHFSGLSHSIAQGWERCLFTFTSLELALPPWIKEHCRMELLGINSNKWTRCSSHLNWKRVFSAPSNCRYITILCDSSEINKCSSSYWRPAVDTLLYHCIYLNIP